MSKITDSARGEPCALNLPGVCNYDPATTVWAHDNNIPGGKAKGKKLARYDHIGAYACYACHMVLDGQAKRPATLTLQAVEAAMVRAVRVCADKLKAKGLWPSDEALAGKPVTVQRIVKKVVALEDRQKGKGREPVRAGHRGLSSRKTTNNVGTQGTKPVRLAGESAPRTAPVTAVSKRIVAGSNGKENAPSRFPKGRKLQSANRLQSRPFGAK